MPESIYECPTPGALMELPELDCLVAPGNIQAIAFHKVQAVSPFTAISIATLATWTPMLAADDATAIRVVPAANFETTPGEPITEGGNDQTTYRGRPKLKYVGFSPASYMLEGVSSEFAKAVKSFTSMSNRAGQRSNLRAIFLTDEGNIITGPDFQGFEIFNHVVQDVKKGGAFKLEDNYGVTFGLDYGWSLNQKITKAAFDPMLLVQYTS